MALYTFHIVITHFKHPYTLITLLFVFQMMRAFVIFVSDANIDNYDK